MINRQGTCTYIFLFRHHFRTNTGTKSRPLGLRVGEGELTNKTCGECKCPRFMGIQTIANETLKAEVNEKLREIQSSLTLNKTRLSRAISRRISAPDPRVSSKVMGGVAVTVLSVCCAVIVFSDVLKFLRFVCG